MGFSELVSDFKRDVVGAFVVDAQQTARGPAYGEASSHLAWLPCMA